MKRFVQLPLLLGVVTFFSFLCLAPPRAQAASGMTQLEYLQWMVQLSGDSGLFTANSSAQDYMSWAQNQGMSPSGGWQANGVLTRDMLAQTLVQFFNIAPPKKGADYVKILLKEGIELPEQALITRAGFVGVVDDFGFQSRAGSLNKDKHSPHKPPTHVKTPPKPPKPPTPHKKPTPKVKTPKKPTPHHP